MHCLYAICVLLATATALATKEAAAASVASPTIGTNSSTSTIPPGYTYYEATGSYYKFYERHVSWYVANSTCASEGAHVTVINDAEEADIVSRIVKDSTGAYLDIWIGVRNNRTGGIMDWRTVHGEPLSDVYHLWGLEEPENKKHFTCAALNAFDKKLSSYPCEYKLYLFVTICEISQ